MGVTQILFWFLSVVAIFSALMVVTAKNPVYSVLWLIATFFAISGHYILLNAQFLAIVNIIVYAGAIMVLFVFSIMLLNYNEIKSEVDFKSNFVYISILSAFILALALAILFKTPFTPLMGVENGIFTDELVKNEGGNIMALSKLLFSKYFMHFEIISLLLLVALIGALTVAKRKVD